MNDTYMNHDKSLALLHILRWETVYAGEGICVVVKDRGTIGVTTAYWMDSDGPHVDLYEPTNMALAWQALTTLCERPEVAPIKRWWENQEWLNMSQPRDVQSLWLDTVLSHLIDAGTILPSMMVAA